MASAYNDASNIFFTFNILSIDCLTTVLSYCDIRLVLLEMRRGGQIDLPQKRLLSKSPALLGLTMKNDGCANSKVDITEEVAQNTCARVSFLIKLLP